MIIRFMLIFTLTFIQNFVGYSVEPVLAGTCSVDTIVKWVQKGQSRDEIREKCDKANVRRCSLAQVVRMAENGETARHIYNKCERE